MPRQSEKDEFKDIPEANDSFNESAEAVQPMPKQIEIPKSQQVEMPRQSQQIDIADVPVEEGGFDDDFQ